MSTTVVGVYALLIMHYLDCTLIVLRTTRVLFALNHGTEECHWEPVLLEALQSCTPLCTLTMSIELKNSSHSKLVGRSLASVDQH